MAQALSEDEFQRMQAQLLELRTQNYQLSDQVRKQNAELSSLRQKSSNVERDLARAQKAVTKSKKAQEVDALLSENEMLQGKLHSQEDDFRLQNTTLMQELSKLCSQIEELEAENKRMKEGYPVSDTASPPSQVDGELLRLQAENTALQKNMAALQQRYEAQIHALRQSEEKHGDGQEMDIVDGQGPDAELKEEVEETSDKGTQESNKTLLEKLEQAESKCTKLEERLKELNEMELKWETEHEEKRLLKEQLQALETSKQLELNKLQDDISKVSEKLKKKHESFLHLQSEKEALYNDSRTKIEEVQQRKEEDLKSLNTRNQRLQQELQAANQVECQSAECQEQVESILSENDALRTGLAALEQIQTAKTQEMNGLRDQVTSLTLDLQQRQCELEALMAQRDDLSSQFQVPFVICAEKRKAMLDVMAIETQQLRSRHKEELSDLRVQHDKEVLGVRAKYEKELRELHEEKQRSEEDLRAQLRDEKARSRELEAMQHTVEDLRQQVQAMEGAKGWFERRLKEAEDTLVKVRVEHEDHVQKLREQHAAELQAKDQEIEAVSATLTSTENDRNEQEKTITKLHQEIKDTVDGQRILEKKGSSALKDLKKQLQLERRRADKLQERLQEILTKSRTGLEDLVLAEISSPSRAQTGDGSSVSSYSYREAMKEGASSTKSNTGSPQSQRPADLSDDEISDLFQRLADIQQEKWMLEERVRGRDYYPVK
ncbi:GRIP1-associated protein 1 [Rhincodon typus]|uniref:GRIP1-associated protein 1 n=1 Tax=Rhincodon typus TaxID=259920 RepID=UPI00203057CB|nr:GRIP1-associated protein 1 [Rhincodon typus]